MTLAGLKTDTAALMLCLFVRVSHVCTAEKRVKHAK